MVDQALLGSLSFFVETREFAESGIVQGVDFGLDELVLELVEIQFGRVAADVERGRVEGVNH